MTRCVPTPGKWEEGSWSRSGSSPSPGHGQSRGHGRSRARGRRLGRVQGSRVVAEAWAVGMARSQPQATPESGSGRGEQGRSWSVSHSFLSGCQTPPGSEREELHPRDQELPPPPPCEWAGPGCPRPPPARLPEMAQGPVAHTTPRAARQAGSARPIRRSLSRVLRGVRPSPAGARGLQPGPHAALRRRLRGDVCVPHSAIRISRRGRHTLLNLCLHAALTFTVFAGGINRTKHPALCQAVSAVPACRSLQSERGIDAPRRGGVGRRPLHAARTRP